MEVLVLFTMFCLGTYGYDKGIEECSQNKYESECTVIQGKEYCKIIIKDYCLNYNDGDFKYTTSGQEI